MLKQKTEWYKQKQYDINEKVEVERESIPLDRKTMEKEIDKIEESKEAVKS